MLSEIKNRIEFELAAYIRDLNRHYSLNRISPIISKNVGEFALRQGKRVRPSLFIISYLGFAKKPAPGLYRSAVSLEFLHDFMLVHDDIIDKSSTRRGKPSMHVMLQKYLRGKQNLKFDGKDLAIVIGDVMYAFSIHSFLSIRENIQRKEAALKKLIEAAIYTGSGEFIELFSGLKGIEKTTLAQIYKIYDYKTATYTFSSPLAIGAILAGAKKTEVDKVFKYGISLGRAFQIKDDIIGMFGKESEIGKPNLTDIQEAKKTLLIWYAYNKSGRMAKTKIRNIFRQKKSGYKDLSIIRNIVRGSGALDYAHRTISRCLKHAEKIIATSAMRPAFKRSLHDYALKLLAT